MPIAKIQNSTNWQVLLLLLSLKRGADLSRSLRPLLIQACWIFSSSGSVDIRAQGKPSRVHIRYNHRCTIFEFLAVMAPCGRKCEM